MADSSYNYKNINPNNSYQNIPPNTPQGNPNYQTYPNYPGQPQPPPPGANLNYPQN